jgi:hypothetical protein
MARSTINGLHRVICPINRSAMEFDGKVSSPSDFAAITSLVAFKFDSGTLSAKSPLNLNISPKCNECCELNRRHQPTTSTNTFGLRK